MAYGSVLVLAAIGLAITFGVMGVINMAHGELIMIGAYTTYLVQLAALPNACSTIPCSSPYRRPSHRGRVVRHRHRARRDPLPLRPAAGDPAGDLRHLSLILQQLVRTLTISADRT
jgi:ABC-type branched-subunit amino acid transport system permease subunit